MWLPKQTWQKGTTSDGKFTLLKSECLASCDVAPVVMVNDDLYKNLTPEKMDENFGWLRVEAKGLVTTHGSRKTHSLRTSGCTQTSIHLMYFVNTMAINISRRPIKEHQPEDICDMVMKSGLKGRGGAGFSTGLKWSFVPRDIEPRYLCCNADESEPGTFSNRYVLEKKSTSVD